MPIYNKKNLDLYIQRGFVTQLPKDAEKKPLNMLFNLNRWLKESLLKYGVIFNDPCCTPAQTPESKAVVEEISKAGALSTDTPISLITTTAATAYTLADGINGQEKVIKLKTDGGDATVTIAHLNGGSTATFDNQGELLKLQWVDNKWYVMANAGVTIA